jgi:methylmalonyl-CoA carboxyltransferase large subunit
VAARAFRKVESLRGCGGIFYNTLLSESYRRLHSRWALRWWRGLLSGFDGLYLVMVQGSGQLFIITGPEVIKQATGEVISAEELEEPTPRPPSAVMRILSPKDDADAIAITKRLLSYLPSNNTGSSCVASDGLTLVDDKRSIRFFP